MKSTLLNTLCSMIVCLVMVFSLVACGGNSTNQVAEESETSQTNKVSEEKKTEPTAKPKKKTDFTKVNLGDVITTDFIEMSLDEASTAQELLPSDTSGFYSYIQDIEDETFFYLTGTIKNTGGDSYDIKNIYIKMTFDDKYNYTGVVEGDSGTDFYGNYVEPLKSVKYYFSASIPDELIDSYSKCTIQISFNENCELDFSSEEYVYNYEIDLTK